MPATKSKDRRGVALSVRVSVENHERLVARAEADRESITRTVDRVLEMGFGEEHRLGGPTLYSIFRAAADIARSQCRAAGLTEDQFLRGEWADHPKLADRLADNFAALVRMTVSPHDLLAGEKRP